MQCVCLLIRVSSSSHGWVSQSIHICCLVCIGQYAFFFKVLSWNKCHWHSNRVHVLLHMRLYHVQSFSYLHPNPSHKGWDNRNSCYISWSKAHYFFDLYALRNSSCYFCQAKKNNIIWDYNPFKESTKVVSNFICLFNFFRLSLNRIYCHAICKTYCWRAKNCTKMRLCIEQVFSLFSFLTKVIINGNGRCKV